MFRAEMARATCADYHEVDYNESATNACWGTSGAVSEVSYEHLGTDSSENARLSLASE
jgi:hypothetical protein